MLAMLVLAWRGFFTFHPFAQHIWDDVGLLRLARFTGLFVAVVFPVLAMAPWLFARLALFLIALGTAFAIGPVALLAVALLLFSSCMVGMRVLGQKDGGGEDQLLSTATGLALYIFAMTLVARLPIHYPAVWGGLLLLPILLDARAALARLRGWARRLAGTELRPVSQRLAAALLVLILTMQWLVILAPEKSADGLAMHLAIPANIAHRHQLTFEPSRQVWAVMPMGADYGYSIVYLLGGEFASRLLNYAMLLLLTGLLYRRLRAFVSPATSLLLTALFTTTPLVQLVTGSLFVENTFAVMVLGSVCALWRFQETRRPAWLYGWAMLAGCAVSVKFGGVGFLAMALPWFVWEGRRAIGSAMAALLLFAAMAAPPYWIAWKKTGNPIFPSQNEKIHSPLLDPTWQFQDNEFQKRLTWTAPYDLTFHTHAYYEGQDGTFGYQYLLFLPLGLLGLLVTRSRAAAAVFLMACGGSILVLLSAPNARFLYVAMPLLFLPFAALLQWLQTHARPVAWAVLSMVVACAGLNLYFLPGSSWYHKDFYMRSPFSAAGRAKYMRDNVPIRTAIQRFNRVHPDAPLFLANDEDAADPQGDAYLPGWHQMSTYEQVRKAKTLAALADVFERWGVHYATARKLDPGEHRLTPVLEELIDKCGVLEDREGPIEVLRIDRSACLAQR